jgi:hypothetical protein
MMVTNYIPCTIILLLINHNNNSNGQSAVNAVSAAEVAASRKEAKYSTLSKSYQCFLLWLLRRSTHSPPPVRFSYLRLDDALLSEGQILAIRPSFVPALISVAIQRFNGACLVNTFELAAYMMPR